MITNMALEDKQGKCMAVCLVLEILGFVLHTIGYATPYWRTAHFKYGSDTQGSMDFLIQGFDEGLWRRCVNGICSGINIAGRDWLQAVRAFESLAVITSTVSTFLIAFYFIFPKRGQGRKVCLISIIACLLTGGAVMLASITYGASVKQNISWSFGIVVAGGIFYVISGIIMLVVYYTLMGKYT